MNMRLIAMLSSVAVLVSTTSSTGTDTLTSPVTRNPGITASTDSSSQSTSETTPSSSTSSASFTTTSSLSTSDSTTPTLKSLSSVNMPNTPNNTHITISTNHNNQKNNTPSTSNVHIPIINSTQQPNGSAGKTNQVPSVTTASVTVPVTTVQQTTAIECNCSKYLQTSTTSASKQTPITQKTTVAPTTKNTTVAPTTQNTTVAPTTQNTTIAPTTKNITVAPTTKNTTVAPTTKNTTIAPTTKKTTVAPTTQNTTVAPTTQKTTVAPTTQKTTVAPTTQNTTVAPTTKNTTVAPTTQNTTVAPTTQNTTVAPTTQNITVAPITQNTTVAPTTQKTIVTPTATTPIPVTTKPATTPATHTNRRRRGVVYVEIDEIESEEQSILYDDTSSHDLYCMNECNITMNETTPVPPLTTTTEMPTTTTPKPTTTTPRHRSIDLNGKLVDLNLVIVVNDTFKPDMAIQNSSVYKDLANQYEKSLTEFYKSLLHSKLRKIVIHGFSNGSIKCNYSLEMNSSINESDANSTLQILRNVNWKNASITNLTLDVNKTATAQAGRLADDLVFLPANVCVNNEVLEWDNDGHPICKYKCDTPRYKGKCGDHGECSFTYGGVFRCICKDGYSGEPCITPKPTTTTAKPIKPDAIALSKIDIIGIAGGIGGGLVLILLVALCCVYTKLNKAKKRDRFYGYMDNDKEFFHDENSRIENVPDLKNEYTNLGYQTEQNELQMQRFEPEGKNVEYEPGQRQGAYERDDKAYRQVEEPEGGNVLIYQPKHLNGPMERQSGASKFDEVEERSNPYRMMDTDTTYKIRRPTVNSDRNVPYN